MKNNELNPIILSSLYNDELYSLEKKPLLQNCASFGKNHKSCVILVNEPQHTILSQQDITFLENILKAIQYNLNDVIIINISNKAISLSEIQKEYSIKQLILFNILPFEIEIKHKNIRQYEIIEHEKMFLLAVDSLQVITQNINKKKALWVSLQRMFKQ